MDIILTVPAIVFLFGVLVFFHELGHFFTAKLLKMKVEEFAFGFGSKKLVLFKRGDTEYTIHPIPLGGFVKLKGMDPTDTGVQDGFTSKPWWQRFLVFLAGPTMSILLAYVIFCLHGLYFGIVVPTNQIAKVQAGSAAQQVGLKANDRIDIFVLAAWLNQQLAFNIRPSTPTTE